MIMFTCKNLCEL